MGIVNTFKWIPLRSDSVFLTFNSNGGLLAAIPNGPLTAVAFIFVTIVILDKTWAYRIFRARVTGDEVIGNHEPFRANNLLIIMAF